MVLLSPCFSRSCFSCFQVYGGPDCGGVPTRAGASVQELVAVDDADDECSRVQQVRPLVHALTLLLLPKTTICYSNSKSVVPKNAGGVLKGLTYCVCQSHGTLQYLVDYIVFY